MNKTFFFSAAPGTKKSAFTFVEVVMATVIIVVGLIPVCASFISTTSDISYTIDEVLATTYANELMDAIISHSYDEIPVSIARSEVTSLGSNAFFQKLITSLSQAKPGFKRYVEIIALSAGYVKPQNLSSYQQKKFDRLNKLKLVRVSIEYKSGGRPRELNIGTIATCE